MNASQAYQHLLSQGYSPTEAEDMVEEELEFERLARHDRKLEDDTTAHPTKQG